MPAVVTCHLKGFSSKCFNCLMCVRIQLLSCVLLFATPWTVAARRLCPWDIPGKILERVAIPLPGDLPDPGLEPASPVPQVILLPA